MSEAAIMVRNFARLQRGKEVGSKQFSPAAPLRTIEDRRAKP